MYLGPYNPFTFKELSRIQSLCLETFCWFAIKSIFFSFIPGQVKTMGGNDPKRQATSKPLGGSGQTRHTATSPLASQLPKPTNHTAAVSGRYRVPGKFSQFKPVSSETSGGQRSTKPTPGVGKKGE